MIKQTILLGEQARLSALYSYPNIPDSSETLRETILHWFCQTLERDGLKARGAVADLLLNSEEYLLQLSGPDELAGEFERYGKRLPALLQNGWEALTTTIPKLKQEGRWNPEQSTESWRFFLPLGLPMVNQRSLQFFHYPPIRLLDPMRDYLYDPVPVRWEELLEANGVASQQEARLYETVVDATPIAAGDDQGSKKSPEGDPHWGLIPIQYFHHYQRALVQLLLNSSSGHAGYTIPIVVYGAHPRETFQELYLEGRKLGVNQADIAEIIPGLKTPILGANHPYRFYAQAQISGDQSSVGSGTIVPENCPGVVKVMQDDLAAARWQVKMAEDPTQEPKGVISACEAFWRDQQQQAQVCALTQHQGSLLYPDPASLEFQCRLSIEESVHFCDSHQNNPCTEV